MSCFVILLLFNKMQMSLRRFSAIPHLRGAPVLYIVALSELKLNENSEHDEVVMYQNMLHV